MDIAPIGARTTPLDPRFGQTPYLGAARPAPAPGTRTMVTVRRGQRGVVTVESPNMTALSEMITAFEAGDDVEDARDLPRTLRTPPAPPRVRGTTRLGTTRLGTTGLAGLVGLGDAEGGEGDDGLALLPSSAGYDPTVANPALRGVAAGRMSPAQRQHRIGFLVRTVKLKKAERTRLELVYGRMARSLVDLKKALMSARDGLRVAIMNHADPGRIAKLTEGVKSLEAAVSKLERDMVDVGQLITQAGVQIDDATAELLTLGVEV